MKGGIVRYQYHKVSHLSKNCRYQVLVCKEKDTKGKRKVYVDEIHGQSGKTWRKKIEKSGTTTAMDGGTTSTG